MNTNKVIELDNYCNNEGVEMYQTMLDNELYYIRKIERTCDVTITMDGVYKAPTQADICKLFLRDFYQMCTIDIGHNGPCSVTVTREDNELLNVINDTSTQVKITSFDIVEDAANKKCIIKLSYSSIIQHPLLSNEEDKYFQSSNIRFMFKLRNDYANIFVDDVGNDVNVSVQISNQKIKLIETSDCESLDDGHHPSSNDEHSRPSSNDEPLTYYNIEKIVFPKNDFTITPDYLVFDDSSNLNVFKFIPWDMMLDIHEKVIFISNGRRTIISLKDNITAKEDDYDSEHLEMFKRHYMTRLIKWNNLDNCKIWLFVR